MNIKEREGLVRRLRTNDLQLAAMKSATDQIIINAAGASFKRLLPYRQALLNKIETLTSPTTQQIQSLDEYDDFLVAVANESRKFNTYVNLQLDVVSMTAFELAANHVFEVSRSFGLRPNIIPPDRMDILREYLAPEGELAKSIAKWGVNVVDQVRQAIIDNVALGKSPRTIAALIRKAYGVNLTDALRMTRTVQIWSYREATRAQYIANSDVYKGWIWWSVLDPERTCISCVAQHGTVHPLSEPLDDHYNGLCTMLGYPMGLEVIESLGRPKSGEEFLSSLNQGQLIKMMGPGKYDAWKGGAFTLNEMSKQVNDNIFGTMRTPTPLWELLGAEPPIRYKG